MGQVIPFDQISKNELANLADLQAEFGVDTSLVVSGGFPSLSIKGSKFAISKSGDREVIRNPETGDIASAIELCVIDYNKGTSKVFYEAKYEDGSAEKPTCYSNDGKTPADDSESKQSPNCSTCTHNQWGSRITDSGKKAKACSDSRRLAVASPSQINEPMLLRVPATSMKNLGDCQKKLSNRRLPLQAVVIKVSFDEDASSPLLHFAPVGMCDADMLADIKAIRGDDVIQQIIGTQAVDYVDDTPAPVSDFEKETADGRTVVEKRADEEAAEAKKKAPAKKAPAKKKPEQVAEVPAAEGDDALFAALDAL